jgi:hypothetical protein
VADQFEEVIEGRVAALESQVAAESESVKEHFVEFQSFVTFSLTRQTAELTKELAQQAVDLRTELTRQTGELRTELRHEIAELRGEVKRDISRIEQRLDGLDRKVVAQHEATRLILADILERLPARRG